MDRGGHSRRGLDLSHTTEQITHRIAPQVDGERDLILSDLTTAGVLSGTRWIDGFHKEMEGRKGGGDPWQTDGRLPVATLVPAWTLEPAEGGLPEPRAEALSY